VPKFRQRLFEPFSRNDRYWQFLAHEVVGNSEFSVGRRPLLALSAPCIMQNLTFEHPAGRHEPAWDLTIYGMAANLLSISRHCQSVAANVFENTHGRITNVSTIFQILRFVSLAHLEIRGISTLFAHFFESCQIVTSDKRTFSGCFFAIVPSCCYVLQLGAGQFSFISFEPFSQNAPLFRPLFEFLRVGGSNTSCLRKVRDGPCLHCRWLTG
jgi:hypothetical protein